ncbi:unnamed protein product [Lactuca virosa]|uniref:Peptidylprolyl isomerase n=1 Tax=Lactuca virosa TaxID=75947 RepID=A0AAU9PHS7_9ASTR|nr:unnamed protein product [Lactuca virosa]
MESKNVKAFYRRAQAYIIVGDLDLDEIDIKKALEIAPENRDLKMKYKVLKEKMREYNKKDVMFCGNIPTTSCKNGENGVKYIENDTFFREEEKKQTKVLKVSCNLNNAACKLKTKEYKEVEKLCTKVLEMESKNVKALYRRAQAYIIVGDLDLDEIDIKKALEIAPENRDLKMKYKVLKEKMREYNKKDVMFCGNIPTTSCKNGVIG